MRITARPTDGLLRLEKQLRRACLLSTVCGDAYTSNDEITSRTVDLVVNTAQDRLALVAKTALALAGFHAGEQRRPLNRGADQCIWEDVYD